MQENQKQFIEKLTRFGLKANTDQSRMHILNFENNREVKLPTFYIDFLEKIEAFDMLGIRLAQSDELEANMTELESHIQEHPKKFPKGIEKYIHIGEEEENGSFYIKKSNEEAIDSPVFYHDWEDNSLTEVAGSIEVMLQEVVANTYDLITEKDIAKDKEEEEYLSDVKGYMENNFAELLNS